jgi:hypothetical protein
MSAIDEEAMSLGREAIFALHEHVVKVLESSPWNRQKHAALFPVFSALFRRVAIGAGIVLAEDRQFLDAINHR